jgi:HSP20 family protein
MDQTFQLKYRPKDDPAGVRRVRQLVRVNYHQYCPTDTWTPDVNLYEDDRNYYVVADLAGVGSQAIDLECRDGRLVLSGHRTMPPPPEVFGEVRVHHMEIDYGRFCRELVLPSNVDETSIEAVYRTGQLLVTLPKATPPRKGGRRE